LLAAPITAAAQTSGQAADQNPDLDFMRAKATSDPQLQRIFQQILQTSGKQQRRSPSELIAQFAFRSVPALRGGITTPIDIEAAAAIGSARMRAQVMSQIMVADLNGDWEITRAELKAALGLMRITGAAEAFFSSDADNDGVLTGSEIRAAIALQASMRNRSSRQETSVLSLFDFNEDNILTPEEYDRAVAAFDN